MSLLPPETRFQQIALTSKTDAYPYESPLFHQLWWSHLSARFDIPFKNRELLIFRKRWFKGFFSLREMRVAGWNLAWSQDLTADRLDEMEAVNQSTNWDYFRIRWSLDRREKQAFGALHDKGYPLLSLPAPVQHGIDMRHGLEGYLQSLNPENRNSLTEAVRLAQDAHPRLASVENTEGIAPFFEELFVHHCANALPAKSYFHSPEERAFTVTWAKALHESGNLLLERLLMNKETVNLSVSIRYGKTVYWLLTTNTGLYGDYQPERIGLYLRLENLARQGVARFNLGSDNDTGQTIMANEEERCQELIIANPRSLRGRLYLWWLKRRQGKS